MAASWPVAGRALLWALVFAGPACSLLDKQRQPEILSLTTTEGDSPSVGRRKKVQIRLATNDADNDELDFLFVATGGTFTTSGRDTLEDLFQDSITVEWEAPGQPGTYDLLLEVSDGKSSEKTTGMLRIVVTQQPPTANAGLSRLIDYGDTLRVVLDGTGSLDPDDDPLKFVWEQIGGPRVLGPGDASLETPDFLAIAPGDYVFVLRVSDDVVDTTGAFVSGPDTVRIRVSDRGGREP